MMLMIVTMFALASLVGCEKRENPTPNAAPNAPAPAAPQAQAPAPAAPAPVAAVQAKLPGGDVLPDVPINLGYILWGGELPLFWGMGGTQTRAGTIFAEHGLNFKLFAADNTAAQIAMYKRGETPFLRMTFTTISRYLAELCPTPNADLCPEKAFQLTWSAGDHLVCRDKITDIKQLKGATISIQNAGQHEGFLFEILRDVNLKMSDVNIVWAAGISNDPKKDDPPNHLRDNAKVDCAFAVSPDMTALTGGLTSKGSGAEGSVKGAHVLVSTADRRKSIPDFYFVSHKFNAEHHDTVTKFAAAYMKSVEKVTALRHDYEDKNKGSEELRALFAFAMQVNDTWKGGCPSESETFGLLLDASFVGVAGNVEWDDPANPTGHKYFSDLTNDLAEALSVTTARVEVPSAKIDWNHAVFNGLVSGNVKRTARFNAEKVTDEIEKLNQTGMIASNSMISFSVYFAEDQSTFDDAQYGKDFDQAITYLSKYTRAPIVIRGHVDSVVLMAAILQNGINAGIIKQAGVKGAFTYSYKGSPLSLDNAKPILDLIQKERSAIDVDSRNREGHPVPPPSKIVQVARDKSVERAGNVRDALIAYAAKKGVKLDESQIQVIGAGASDPFIVKPRGPDDSAKNRRVEFSIVRVSAEAATASDYEL